MNDENILKLGGSSAAVQVNSVLKNTYLLLSGTLLFSALMAGFAVMINMPPVNVFVTLGGYFLFLFLASKYSDRAIGLLWVFALTGFMGFTLGGIVNVYVKVIPNGAELIASSLFFTSIIFLGISAYAVTSKKDFSFMGGMLTAGILTLFLVSLAAYFFNWPAVSLAVSAGFVLFSSGLILFETSRIVNGGQTNYILATITLFVSLYNLFMSLLHLLTAFGGDE